MFLKVNWKVAALYCLQNKAVTILVSINYLTHALHLYHYMQINLLR